MPSIDVAASIHSQRHAYGGLDPLTPESIRAAPRVHAHEIGEVNNLAEALAAAATSGGSGGGGGGPLRDTGWRLISPMNSWSGQIHIRRSGSVVHFRAVNLRGVEATSSNIVQVPAGFRPGASLPAHGMGNKSSNAQSGSDPIGAVGGANNDLIRTFGALTSWTGGSASIQWMTTDAWPTDLPGTEVTPPSGDDEEGEPPMIAWSSIIGQPTTYPPSDHQHSAVDLSGVVKTINSLVPDSNGNVVIPVPTWDTIVGKPATFTPTTHNHSVAEVTGLQTQLNTKASSTHSHTAAEVTGIPKIYATIFTVQVTDWTSGSATLTFPSGTFSSPPVVQATAIGQTYAATTGTPSTGSVNIAVRSVTNSTGSATIKVNVLAVQT